jgi:uncharacterized membrane protein YfcA
MGVGGGTVLIPALVLFCGTSQTEAQAINLAAFLPTGAAALATHLKENRVEKGLAARLALFGATGAVLGSALAVRADGETLRRIFGYFLLAMGAYEFFKKD